MATFLDIIKDWSGLFWGVMLNFDVKILLSTSKFCCRRQNSAVDVDFTNVKPAKGVFTLVTPSSFFDAHPNFLGIRLNFDVDVKILLST